MAIELKRYMAASRPEDDESTSGGAIDEDACPLEANFSASARPEIVSDNAADSMNVTITGRASNGSVVEETKALNGTTEVLFDESFSRILKIVIASAPAGEVTVAEGTGGTVRHTFAAGETDAAIFFQYSAAEASGGSSVDRYEKQFWKNEDATLALLGAEVELTADPDSRFEMALAAAVDDSVSVADRLTAPAGGLTFVDDNVAQGVPGDDLDAGEAIGVWIKQTLAAGAAAALSTFTTEISGTEA